MRRDAFTRSTGLSFGRSPPVTSGRGDATPGGTLYQLRKSAVDTGSTDKSSTREEHYLSCSMP
jgi:hypothetical protein